MRCVEEATGGVRSHENGGATLAKNGSPDSDTSTCVVVGLAEGVASMSYLGVMSGKRFSDLELKLWLPLGSWFLPDEVASTSTLNERRDPGEARDGCGLIFVVLLRACPLRIGGQRRDKTKRDSMHTLLEIVI